MNNAHIAVGAVRGRALAVILTCVAVTAAATSSLRASETPTLLVVGDSLTAGYLLAPSQAYPALLAETWQQAGLAMKVINSGVSGDTSAGGAQRLPWLIKHTKPTWVMIALGGNDGLRGLPLSTLEANLTSMITEAKQAGAQVVLAGMQLPPNLGPKFVKEFAAIYPRLATKHHIALIPFLLDGVAADPKLNLPDGIHPNAAGHVVIAQRLDQQLRPWLFPATKQEPASGNSQADTSDEEVSTNQPAIEAVTP